MSSPPAARPSSDIRLSPADGRALLMPSYDLRGRDGKFICSLTSAQAERGLLSEALELWTGRHGVYLRATALRYPDISRQPSRVEAKNEVPKGAIRPPVESKLRPATGLVGSFRSRRVGG